MSYGRRLEFSTEDNYQLKYLFSTEVSTLDEVHKHMKNGYDLGLRTVVIPIRVDYNLERQNRFRLDFYDYEAKEQ